MEANKTRKSEHARKPLPSFSNKDREKIGEHTDLCLDILDRLLSAAEGSKEVKVVDRLSMQGKAATLRVALAAEHFSNGELSQAEVHRMGKIFAAFYESAEGVVLVLGARAARDFERMKKVERNLMTHNYLVSERKTEVYTKE